MARRIRVPSCQHWLVLDLGSLHVLPEASQFLDDEIRLLFEDPVAALLDDAALCGSGDRFGGVKAVATDPGLREQMWG